MSELDVLSSSSVCFSTLPSAKVCFLIKNLKFRMDRGREGVEVIKLESFRFSPINCTSSLSPYCLHPTPTPCGLLVGGL